MKLTFKPITALKMLLLLILFNAQNVFSVEIEGVVIPDSVKTDSGSLVLNGAGIRTKFFFDIYIGSLYLKKKESNVQSILKDINEKKITLHFLYKEVSKEKLTKGWTAGFKNNNPDSVFTLLKARLDKFNSFFETTHRGDVITLDFLNTKNTRVTINGKLKGDISGSDFKSALLNVWLGDDPADYNLKEAMLGTSDY